MVELFIKSLAWNCSLYDYRSQNNNSNLYNGKGEGWSAQSERAGKGEGQRGRHVRPYGRSKSERAAEVAGHVNVLFAGRRLVGRPPLIFILKPYEKSMRNPNMMLF